MGEGSKLLINVVAVLVLVGVWLRWYAIEVVVVQDNGMAPTLVYGDEVLVWRGAMVEMANVMVCEHPARRSQTVIGRAVAFAGHSISTDYMGSIYVDDDKVGATGSGSARFYDVTRKKNYHMIRSEVVYRGMHPHDVFVQKNETFSLRTYTVKKGVYLLGDNRAEVSFDSRSFGEVDPERCLGQVFMHWKPAPSRGDDVSHHILQQVK